MPITTDTATNIGKVRLLIADTVDASAIFTDAEIQAFLDMDGAVRPAASSALIAITADKSRLFKVMQSGDDKTEQQTITDLLKLAEAVKIGGSASQLQTAEINVTDEHYESYRPSWRDTSTVVVE